MNRNPVPVFLFVLLMLMALGSTWIIVRSNDLLRFEMEKIHEELKKQNSRPVVVASAFPAKAAPAANIANRQEYDPNRVPGDRYLTASAADSGNMNEILSNDAAVSEIWEYAGAALAERSFTDISKFEPMLAESWEVLEGGLRFRIHLRKGVLWHDFTDPVTGKKWVDVEMKAQDFKFYADTVKNEKVDALPLRTYLADLDRIEVRSDFEFDVIWRKKYFLSEEITLTLSPLARHLYHAYPGPFDPVKFNSDDARNRMIVGVGPYRFDRWEKGKRMVLRRNEKYFGKALGIAPAIETLSIELIKHPNTRLQAAAAGELDATSLTPDQWIHRTGIPAFTGKNPSLRKIQHPSPVYNYIGFNLRNPLFQDRKVRQALTLLIDRQRILKEIYFGLARPVTGPFFPDAPANDSTLPVPEFSVAKARKLLEEAGWREGKEGILEKDGKKLEFSILYPNANPIYARMLPLISQDMMKAGVKMKLMGLEWTVCLQRLDQHLFETVALGWSGGINPDPYQLWHSSQADRNGSSNFIGFKDKEADSLIEQIRITFDPEERKKLYHRFHRKIYEEAPYIFLFSPMSLSAVSTRYENLKVYPLGYTEKTLWTKPGQQKAF